MLMSSNTALDGTGFREQCGRLEYIGAVQDVTQRNSESTCQGQSELAHVARVRASRVTASIARGEPAALRHRTNASTVLRMLTLDPPNVDGARERPANDFRDGTRGVR